MINAELFYSLEYIINTASQIQELADKLDTCNEVTAVSASWTCQRLPVGGVAWVYHTVKDHDYTFGADVSEVQKEALMAKLEQVIQKGGYTSLPLEITPQRANQLAEDVAEATGGK